MIWRNKILTAEGAVAGLPAAVVFSGGWREEFGAMFGNAGEDLSVGASRIATEHARTFRCPLGDVCELKLENHGLRGLESETYIFCPKQAADCKNVALGAASRANELIYAAAQNALVTANLVIHEPEPPEPMQPTLF